MDILHLNKQQIREMELQEYLNAIEYSWTTYIKRDINYNLYKFFRSEENEKSKPFGDIDWTGTNPVEQALRAKKREIPKNFLESLNKK